MAAVSMVCQREVAANCGGRRPMQVIQSIEVNNRCYLVALTRSFQQYCAAHVHRGRHPVPSTARASGTLPE